MRKVTSSDTTPELLLRQALWAKKYRYRVNNTGLPGKPDLLFPKARVAVFVDGDFWHGGQWRKRKLAALEEQFTGNRNKEYWLKKIRRNMDRDCMATADLTARGWTVLRFWEWDIKRRLEECVRIIGAALEEDWARSGRHPLSLIPRRTVAEFFAGFGFIRMGLEKEGWTVAFTHEPDLKKRRIYEGRFGKSARSSAKSLSQISGEAVPEVTLAIASLPSNHFLLTKAGKGFGEKQFTAFWEMIRIIGEMGERKPPFVLLECKAVNLYSRAGDDLNDLKEALGLLNNLGYEVDVFILDVANFTPMNRKSLFTFGRLEGIGEGEINEPARDWESMVRPGPLADFIIKNPEIHWRIRELPACPARKIGLENILEEVPSDSKLWWSAERAGYLFSQMSPLDQAEALRMMNQDRYRYAMIQRQIQFGESRVKFRTDGMVELIPAFETGDQLLFKAGKGKYTVRRLTPREWARLIGVADDWIVGRENQALSGFEDTVYAPLIQWIARYYLNPLACELIRGRPVRPVIGG